MKSIYIIGIRYLLAIRLIAAADFLGWFPLETMTKIVIGQAGFVIPWQMFGVVHEYG